MLLLKGFVWVGLVLSFNVEKEIPAREVKPESATRFDSRTVAGACACDANVREPQQAIVDILDWGAVLGCAFSNNCTGCNVSCDVNCDGMVNANDVGAVWCRSIMGGSLGVECCTDPIGACVNATSVQGQPLGCLWTTAAGCQVNTGTFFAGLTCEQGACQTQSGCTQKSQAECVSTGGSFQGVGSQCPSPNNGACETPSGCLITSPTSCAAQGGTYQGQGTTCPRGACATQFGCGLSTPQSCALIGGLFLGPGSDCQDCVTDNDCGSGFQCGPNDNCILRVNAIPTTSTWGIIVLALLLLTAAKLHDHRCHA
ncbi:MAG: hypothetical protein AABZ47_03885 [Planctomycetota bacterium]